MKTSSGDFHSVNDRFNMFNSILSEYETYNISGGSLHIYLEDGNKSVDDIKFCRDYAERNKDWIGVYLCEELLFFGEEFIQLLIEEDSLSAFTTWNSRHPVNFEEQQHLLEQDIKRINGP
jgi:hypothetical protein